MDGDLVEAVELLRARFRALIKTFRSSEQLRLFSLKVSMRYCLET